MSRIPKECIYVNLVVLGWWGSVIGVFVWPGDRLSAGAQVCQVWYYDNTDTESHLAITRDT